MLNTLLPSRLPLTLPTIINIEPCSLHCALREPNLDSATRGLINSAGRAKQRMLRIVTALSRLRSRRSLTQTG